MRHITATLSVLFTQSAFAQSSAQGVFTAGVIGGASIVGLLLIVWTYRGIKIAVLKLKPVAARLIDRSPRDDGQPRSQASGFTLSYVSIKGQDKVKDVSPTSTTTALTNSDASKQTGSPSESCWSEALTEFQGPDRRAGLWAKVFSESEGNDKVALAEYLRVRANELNVVKMKTRDQLLRDERTKLTAEASAASSASASAAFLQLTNGVHFIESKAIAICEAQLTSLGYEVRRPSPDKWEIFGIGGTTFAYSAEDLRSVTKAITRSRS